MITARVGDVVHYTDPSGHGGCLAAIITYVLDPRRDTLRDIATGATGHVNLTAFGALGPIGQLNIPTDPNAFTVLTDGGTEQWMINDQDRTPGTWHHIH